jgi:hypothetical protein
MTPSRQTVDAFGFDLMQDKAALAGLPIADNQRTPHTHRGSIIGYPWRLTEFPDSNASGRLVAKLDLALNGLMRE